MVIRTLQSPHPSLTALALRSLRHGSRLAVIVAAVLATLFRSRSRESPVSVILSQRLILFLIKMGAREYMIEGAGNNYCNWASGDIEIEPALSYESIHQ